MKKKELLALPTPLATSRMLKLAAANPPKILEEKHWWSKSVARKTVYRYPLYMRCIVQDGIAVISYHMADTLQLGARKPLYTLFVDRAKDQFLTYCHTNDRWLTAKTVNLSWPSYVYHGGNVWISAADRRRLQRYFGSKESVRRIIYEFQDGVRLRQLIARQKRETDPWDEEQKQVPALPKDWLHWVNKVGIPEQFIFYQYRRGGAKTGYCSYCEKDVPIIGKPHHNKDGRCPCCRHQIKYKALGKVGFLVTENYYVYLLQKTACGFVLREFRAWRRQCKGEYQTPKTNYYEIRRSFFTAGGKQISAYAWDWYKQREVRWVRCGILNAHSYAWQQKGRVYGKTLPQLMKGCLNHTGFKEYLADHAVLDPEYYLAVYNRFPRIEQLVKAGLTGMVRECLYNVGNYEQSIPDKQGGSLKKALGLNGQQFKRLRENNGTLDYLLWLQFELLTQAPIPDKVIHWMCEHKVMPRNIEFIIGRMNVTQVCNYMRRQMFIYHMDAGTMLTTWQDYLNMAAGFHYDVYDEIVYRTAKLKRRHDELVRRSKHKDTVSRAGQLLQKFPHVDAICQSLAERYGYTDEVYTVVAPKGLVDIIEEGDTLHHCIASSDRYIERIERHESYLLFLRKTSDTQEPYYTMEVEPNGTVRQIRTIYNQQNKDIDKARAFLREWQRVIAKRLTDIDRKRAEQSRELRDQEFEQMRNDQIKIHDGDLNGKLLVDVLTADLLENAA